MASWRTVERIEDVIPALQAMARPEPDAVVRKA
jgi:hypothetical protein